MSTMVFVNVMEHCVEHAGIWGFHVFGPKGGGLASCHVQNHGLGGYSGHHGSRSRFACTRDGPRAGFASAAPGPMPPPPPVEAVTLRPEMRRRSRCVEDCVSFNCSRIMSCVCDFSDCCGMGLEGCWTAVGFDKTGKLGSRCVVLACLSNWLR